MSDERRLLKLKERELELLKEQVQRQHDLPHIYSEKKLYTWSREFVESTNRENYLCGGNQVSKSSTQIRKCITWATEPSLWPKLWKTQPNLFWYLYPDSDTATSEFDTKWQEWLPRGAMKDDPQYGWRADYYNKKIKNVYFNSGITLSFKYYTQDVTNLQAGSVYTWFCLVDGTKVITPDGEKSIEDLCVGDLVLGQKGFARVLRKGSREAEVRRLVFSNKKEIFSSDEHPFFTKRGWVEAKDLLHGDVCFTTAKWVNVYLRILCCLKGFCIRDVLSRKMLGLGIIGKGLGTKPFMWKYGKSTTEKVCQRGMSFITKILIRLITEWRIFSALLAESTPQFIKNKNGSRWSTNLLYALTVENLLHLGPHKKEPQDTAQRDVLNGTMARTLLVKSVERLFAVGLGIRTCSVLRNVPMSSKEKVNAIAVEKNHTFFANNILTHNCDEEPPINVLPELFARLNATDGYAHVAFTATLGQEHFRAILEDNSKPEAWHKMVSLYDCMEYWDGTPSLWDEEKVRRAESRCTNRKEISRRIYGRFVKDDDSDLLIPKFTEEKNVIPPHPLPKNWLIYGGIDSGSGVSDSASRKKNHAAAFVFIAVSPDFRMARIFGGRKLIGIQTTAADILQYYTDYAKEKKISVTQATYDWADADLYTIAMRKGMSLTKADKDRKSGFQLMNTLFDRGVVKIFDTDELRPLISEIMNLSKHTTKRSKAIEDDYVDCARYALKLIPFDWTFLNEMEFASDKVTEEKLLAPKTELDLRREFVFGKEDKKDDVEQEIEAWAEMFDTY